MEIRPILSALFRNKTGAILIALQVAISMAILANALHIVNVRQAVAARPSGIANETDVFYIQVQNLTSGGFEQRLATQHREEATLRAVSGVTQVAQVNQMPMTRNGSYSGLAVDRKQAKVTTSAASFSTGGNMIKTLGLNLVAGRDFRSEEYLELDPDKDTEGSKIALITQPLAEKLFPGQKAVGKHFYFGTGDNATEVEVIGVVERLQRPGAEVKDAGEYSTIQPERVPFDNGANYAVRVEPGQTDRVIKEAEAALRKAAPNPVITRVKSVPQIRNERYRADMAMAWMLVTVSVLLLLITASGIVGMASLWVTQRRKQIGVRRALGARKIDILRYFLTENFMITSLGIVAGVLGAIGLNAFLVSKLELARLPLMYLVGGAGIFWLLGFFAAYGPAWRAASISPAMATRTA
ncbi:FtsX-like permease family protein [Massilia arenosa]|uniref:FtsX-like permease family protein n=1 Tax=Zemynaea arenosa TaxID=2561931 RepID=A0A4Y9S0Y2_9BURK|nr:FtsX-like permease family protein [Massilia arenosa]TFW13686.1 FtsX-like permease family protein [Massilia arenosa]